MKIAVIDLGTNTFHLLIVETDGSGNFKEIFRERRYVHLAEDGIEKLGDAPYERGLTTMNAYSLEIIKRKVDKVSAKGTAALRRASNGQQFIEEVRQQTGIEIETISGDVEAELIYKGTRQAVMMTNEPLMIMDIGGGSVEFIIANKDTIHWAQSFPIGVAVLYKHFHNNEPIIIQEINALKSHLFETLEPLTAFLQEHPVSTIVGASGTFDVLSRVLEVKHATKHSADVELKDFHPLYQKLVAANFNERLGMEEIPNHRAKLIVVAVILVDFIIQNYGITDMKISSFAMKEGMIAELMSE
jgi:exopolyphosphatase/guanosine-5'-triphosphate,3'-diphosphate pyrophosphatase